MSVEPTPCENTLKTGEDRVPSIDGPWVGSQPAPRELGASTRASMTITGCGSSSITSITYVIVFGLRANASWAVRFGYPGLNDPASIPCVRRSRALPRPS